MKPVIWILFVVTLIASIYSVEWLDSRHAQRVEQTRLQFVRDTGITPLSCRRGWECSGLLRGRPIAYSCDSTGCAWYCGDER